MSRGILYFDFETKEVKAIRFFVLPKKCVMFARYPRPDNASLYTEWFVHLVDAYQLDDLHHIWKIVDREIDIIIEDDFQTYHIIDLEEFGQVIAKGDISPKDAARLLTATQFFLDEYIHGGGQFPPAEIAGWTAEEPRPRRVALDLDKFA